MAYSLRCNTPSEEAINIFDESDSLQRKNIENILGTVWTNEPWHQACLPINKTGIGIRRASDQIKAACIGSISQSATLVELITGQSSTADHIFTKMSDEINGLSLSQLSQSKIQEVLYEVALNNLVESQTSEREKAHLLSPSLPQSGAWLLAAPPIPALGLHLLPNKFCAAVKYRLDAPIYEKESKCPYFKTGSLDTLGYHADACQGRCDMNSRHDRLRVKIFPLAALATSHQFASRKIWYQKQILDLEMFIYLAGLLGNRQL